MLQPARTKYRKQQKGRNKGVATRGNKVSFGEFGLKATTRGRLTARQLEAGRRAMSRHIKRGGRPWGGPVGGGWARVAAPHQARRPHLDPLFSGKAGFAEARGGAHGQR